MRQDPLVKAERILFGKQVAEGLARAGRMLEAVESDVTLTAEEVEELAQLPTLKALEEQLPNTVWKVFRSGFSKEEWDELVASEACILSESRAQLRTLWLKRHKQRLDESCETAIDLTVRDEDEVEEQSTLVNSCTVAVQKLLDRVGMNARGTVKRVVKARNSADDLPLAKAKGGKKRVEIEGEVQVEGEQQVEQEGSDRVVRQKQKSKAKSKAKEKRKTSTASELSFDEEGEDADAEDDMFIALQPEKDKEEEEAEEAELEDDANDNGSDHHLKSVFGQMLEDVPIVAAMLKEAAAGQVVLNVGPVCAPDLKLASEDACKALLANVEELSRCLRTLPDADEVPPVERWGALLKWWRLVEQALSITGLFDYLRGMRRGKKMVERYAGIVKRLKKDVEEGKALSFIQAKKYDRLGRFLLKFPGFVNQFQLVSLADWQQKLGPQNVVLMDAIEDVLSMEEAIFWSEKVVPAQEEQPVAGMMEEQVFNAFEGQVVEQLDLNQGFRSDGMEVEALDEPQFEDDAQPPAPPVVEEEECLKCGLKAQTVFLECDGPGDDHSFCWKCDGYSGPPPDELPFPGCNDDTTIKTYVFCAEHLKLECCVRPFESYKQRGGELNVGDFVNQVQAVEARFTVELFAAPPEQRQFSAVVPIEPNGWCMFVAAAKGVGLEWDVLVREMVTFARGYLRKKANVVALDDIENVRRLWNELDPLDSDSVQEFWASEAADHLIPMLAAHLDAKDKRAVQFRVWVIGKDGALEMTKLVYPEGDAGQFKRVVDLLKTNKIVEHCDLLKK